MWVIGSDTTQVSHNAGKRISVISIGANMTPKQRSAAASWAYSLERQSRNAIGRQTALSLVEQCHDYLSADIDRELWAINTIEGLERLSQQQTEAEAVHRDEKVEPDQIRRLNYAIARLRNRQKKAIGIERKQTLAESIIALQKYRDSLKEGVNETLPDDPDMRREALFNKGVGRYITTQPRRIRWM
ncbi:hypothetical protein [Vibrio algicola]|uniref:Uncharacterized protein n=1 Tax=Vibrio algicola TaxID=2662262 RepID=A0A5Q0TJL4_9VIBR|nr:hypothetical protein [Vibrio algicola]